VVWNHGILNDFPETVGNVIIPTDEVHHFSEGFKPPSSTVYAMENQKKPDRFEW
jgi:hypothetical protein